jgi:hydroxymethyl cephem carbamoyltransferase
VVESVDRVVTEPLLANPKVHRTLSKGLFHDVPIYNVGVESEKAKAAASLITDRIFDVFAAAAREHLPSGMPLYIAGGCGLNCGWNARW